MKFLMWYVRPRSLPNRHNQEKIIIMVDNKCLKPQDSFGEFDKKKSWSSESAGNHQKTPSDQGSDLPAIVWNDIL